MGILDGYVIQHSVLSGMREKEAKQKAAEMEAEYKAGKKPADGDDSRLEKRLTTVENGLAAIENELYPSADK